MLVTELTTRVPDAPAERRSTEPVTVGIPFPAGMAKHADDLAVTNRHGVALPVQWDVLDRWPGDGSIRWALLDAQLSAPDTYAVVEAGKAVSASHADPVVCSKSANRRTIATAGWSCSVEEGSAALLIATPSTRLSSCSALLSTSKERCLDAGSLS
jgi:hypothetical protein